MHNLFLGTSKQRILDGKRDDDATAPPPLPPPGPIPGTDEDRESRAVVWWIISLVSLIQTLYTFNLGSCFLMVATIFIWITIIIIFPIILLISCKYLLYCQHQFIFKINVSAFESDPTAIKKYLVCPSCHELQMYVL